MLRDKDVVPDVETATGKRFWGFGKKRKEQDLQVQPLHPGPPLLNLSGKAD